MTDEEQSKFQAILVPHKVLFDGEFGLYSHKKNHLKLKEDTVFLHKKSCPVPYTRQDVFRWELRNLIKDGILHPCGMTNWVSPTIIIPKPRTNIVRWVSDFRELIKVLECPKYPVPRILDIMLKHQGYSHFTKIDLSMIFYCFELDKKARISVLSLLCL